MLQRRIQVAAITAVRHFTAAAPAADTVAATISGESTTTAAAISSSSSSFSSSGKGRDTLSRRLLGLVHPKQSAVITITKWKQKGHVVRKYELNRIVRQLRKLRRYKHALEICEWMRTQENIKLLPGDYAIHLDLIAKLRGFNSAEKFFEDLPEEMIGAPTLTAMLHTYVTNRAYDEAEAMMKKMTECGFVNCPLPYNQMISMYLENGNLDKIPPLMKELKKNTKPDTVTYNLLIKMSLSQNDVEMAEKVLLDMRKSKIEPDWMTYSGLTSLYMKIEMNDKAKAMLKEMENKISPENRAAYSSLISLYTKLGNINGVHKIWKKMKSLFRKANDVEYSCMISSFIKLGEMEEAEKVYAEWESVCVSVDLRIPNLLLAAYINKTQMDKARRFLDRFKQKGMKPSYTTWELLTWGYLKEKEIDQALYCFEQAVGSVKKWDPDMNLVREVYKQFEEQGNIEGAEKMLLVFRKAGFVSTEVYNLLLRTYAKAGKKPPSIEERMEKDQVSLDEETQKLVRLTSEMCVADVQEVV